jgi:hypothetical protein
MHDLEYFSWCFSEYAFITMGLGRIWDPLNYEDDWKLARSKLGAVSMFLVDLSKSRNSPGSIRRGIAETQFPIPGLPFLVPRSNS